jgi:flagellar protein FlaG
VEQAVARLNDYVQSLQRDIQFSVDAESRQPVVRVVERGSQELIRQIPSETALRLARSLIELSELSELQANDIALFRAEA